MTRKHAASELLRKYNEQYSNTRYYKNHLTWSVTVREMLQTAQNAHDAAGTFEKAIECAEINIFGCVFVNGINCGRIA
jgi:hypothetical protein